MLLLLSVKIALIAIVYISILPLQHPFSKWYAFGYKHFGKTWAYKPLFDCEKCFGGQFALWYYLFQFWGDYSLFEHIYFIAQTIIITQIFCKIYHFIDNKI